MRFQAKWCDANQHESRVMIAMFQRLFTCVLGHFFDQWRNKLLEERKARCYELMVELLGLEAAAAARWEAAAPSLS